MSTPVHTAVATQSVGRNSLPLQIRVLTSNEDAKFDSVLDRVEAAVATTLSAGAKTGTSLVCQFVKLQDHHKHNDISLPVSTTPCLLFREGRSYVCNTELEPEVEESLHAQLDALISTLEPGKIRKDVIEASNDASGSSASSNLPADFVLYVPHSAYHVRILISAWRPTFSTELTRFSYAKDGAPLWAVEMTRDPDTSASVCMSLSWETLSAQFARMTAGQTHGFTLLVRDFLRNAVAVASALGSQTSRKRKLFFPAVFDLAADVKQHYNDKVDRFISQDQSEAGAIRKYNNLVKSILLSHFVPENPVVLDLACGHGQDLNKYRAKNPKLFIGTDISGAALAEAQRRYKQGRFRYPAEFIEGNLMLPDIFAEIRRVVQAHGFTEESPFDVISIQLALHYLVGSKEETHVFFDRVLKLLKPGGRFIATFPCCDRIARRLRNATPTDETCTAFEFGNSNYKVTFAANELIKLIPSVAEVLSAPNPAEAFEAEMEQVDFDEVSQAVGQTWGAQYKFWLVQTIDDQEEYIVPCAALETLLGEMKLNHEMGGNFSEVVSHYSEHKSPVVNDFKKFNAGITLSDVEEEVFKFYRAIVVKKE